MFKNILLEKLRAGKTTIGLCNMYPASGIIEGMCRDWDFVWIDGQHGQHSYQSIHQAVQAAAAAVGTDAVVRVPSYADESMEPYADLAPSAIMIPMVDNMEHAGKSVEGLRFPPLGKRSYGGRRIIDLYGRNYYNDSELIVIAQVETMESVQNANEIISTEGIDMLFFGVDDMKVRMGINIDEPLTESKELMNAMEITAAAAKKAGKYAGCVATNEASMKIAVEMGYQLIAAGTDSGFIRSAASQKLTDMRNNIQKKIDIVSRTTL